MNREPNNQKATERRELALRAFDLRQSGLTFKAIGKQLSVGTQTARNLVFDHMGWLDHTDDWFFGLRSIVSNALLNIGMKSREETLSAYLSGMLKPEKFRGYSWRCHKEVASWLGLPEPKPAKRGPDRETLLKRIEDAQRKIREMDANQAQFDQTAAELDHK